MARHNGELTPDRKTEVVPEELRPFLSSSHKPLPFRESRICRLLHEDRALLVIEKHAGVLTVPTERGEERTVIGALGRYMRARYRSKAGPIAVHRLDRGTSGVLVFAKDRRAADNLIEQFRGRKPARIYIAILAGRLAADSGTIRSHLTTDRFLNQRTTRNQVKGEEAITHFKVLARGTDTTLVRVQLETGRRNQIRAQFADRGHPVLGDDRYATAIARHRRWPRSRLALHAATLGFTHPFQDKPLEFAVALPLEFVRFAGFAFR